MRKSTKIIVIISMFLLFISLIRAENSLEYKSYIIKFKNSFSINLIKKDIALKGNELVPVFSKLTTMIEKKEVLLSSKQNKSIEELKKFYILDITKSDNAPSILEELINNSEIESIEPNYIYRIDKLESIENASPNDPRYNEQWAMKDINIKEAWLKASGDGIIIGVVDTGIDFLHPDLINQLWINHPEDINNNGTFEPWSDKEERDGVFGDINGIDDDGNGYADDVIGYDFVDQTVKNIGESQVIDPIPTDEHGHGTMVSGIISAEKDNKIGISGIAYNSKILTMRAFDATGNGESDDIALSIVYAVLQGAKVLNFSFGEDFLSSIIKNAVEFAYYSGCVMSASSGNSNSASSHYPSDYDEVISVGSSTNNERKDFFSNYGNRLSLIAPGANILSTAINGTYAINSGTSFAAPQVNAVAALLFEIQKDLTPDDINGILQASARDIGDIGWDIRNGAGILDAAKAVNTIGRTNIKILSPAHESIINKDSIQNLAITAIVASPLFDSNQLFIAEGKTPQSWELVGDIKRKQSLNDTIANIDIQSLKDTIYTLRLLVNLKNNNSIEYRSYITLHSSSTPLSFNSFKSLEAIFENRKVAVIYVATNQRAKVFIKYRPKGSSEEYKIVSEYQKFTNYHTIIIEGAMQSEIEMEAVAFAVRSDGIEISKEFPLTLPAMFSPAETFIKKDYSLPFSYLNEDVADLYQNGKASIVVNDISSGDWGFIKVYQFENGEFYLKDSHNNTWLPKGIGDSNGDGIKEIFASVSGQSALFQAKSKGDSPFSSLLFSDTTSVNFWAADMIDLDDDGNDELIAFSDTSYIAYSYKNGKYKHLATAYPGQGIGTFPGFAYGDFDDDGNMEICFGSRKGKIFIYEYSNGSFNFEFPDSNTKMSSSEQYICAPDIDGDGIKEILILNFGSKVPFGNEDAGNPIWTYRLLKSNGKNSYEFIYEGHIFGVRGGIGYSNGINCGNLDNQADDEVIISTFPNLYVLKWNKELEQLIPLWYYPYTFSKNAVIYDFDENGINEIGFGTFSGTRFYELSIDDKPATPLGFRGNAIDENSALFEWQAVESADSYEIIRMIYDNIGYLGYTAAITTETSAIIDTLKNDMHYEFVIRSINENMNEKYSELSDFVDIYTHKPIFPLSVLVNTTTTLQIPFSGKLSSKSIEPSLFEVLNNEDELLFVPRTAMTINDTLMLITFEEAIIEGSYKLRVKTFPDRYNTPTIETIIQFEILDEAKPIELYLKSLDVISGVKLHLVYSESVEIESIEELSNYKLNPKGKIINISLDESNPSAVFIELDNVLRLSALGHNYTLTVKNIVSQAGHLLTTGAGSTLGFVFYEDNPNDAFIYPNPVKISNTNNLYFANLPAKAEVVIMNLDGLEIRRLFENDGNGGVEWNGLDRNGEKLRNGIYIFKVIQLNADGTQIESDMKKFAIIP